MSRRRSGQRPAQAWDQPRGDGQVLALCGGIGGAKLALGLLHVLGDRLTIVVNTGDDFEHLGLHISPDLDTVLYTLAGVSDPDRGWGRADETWRFMETLGGLGGETWFSLGDRDLAMHVERTRRLRAGETLSAFAADVARRLGISARIIPMSDDPVRTVVVTAAGALPFQRYFVEHRCRPTVQGLRYEGAEQARASSDFIELLGDHSLRAVVICPSNPYLSVDPMLAVAGVRKTLVSTHAPVIAVSPIIGGKAVKGPTAKIMAELGIRATSAAVAEHYGALIDGLVIDEADRADQPALSVLVHVAPTLMIDFADRVNLARQVLGFADEIAAKVGVLREARR